MKWYTVFILSEHNEWVEDNNVLSLHMALALQQIYEYNLGVPCYITEIKE